MVKEKFSRTEIDDAIQTRFEKGSMSFINSLATAVNGGQISLEEAKRQLDDSSQETFIRVLGQSREKKISFFGFTE